MVLRPAVVGRALRVVAAGVVAVVLAGIGQPEAERAAVPVKANAPRQPAVAVVAAPPPNAWSLQVDGWYIRVDGRRIAAAGPENAAVVPLAGAAAPPRASAVGTISAFDRLIVHHAKAEGFDWRLIAALIFEESHFVPASRSDKGAYGLMQVRPIAAEAVGAQRFREPDDNVKTGIRYLRQLQGMFSDAVGEDRLCLVLAAYNMGPGHVRDAQLVARDLGYDPNRWSGQMEMMLPLLEQPVIYRHVPNGFAKGHETVAYVHRILARYQQYRRLTAAALPGADADALSSSPSSAVNG